MCLLGHRGLDQRNQFAQGTLATPACSQSTYTSLPASCLSASGRSELAHRWPASQGTLRPCSDRDDPNCRDISLHKFKLTLDCDAASFSNARRHYAPTPTPSRMWRRWAPSSPVASASILEPPSAHLRPDRPRRGLGLRTCGAREGSRSAFKCCTRGPGQETLVSVFTCSQRQLSTGSCGMLRWPGFRCATS